MSADNEAEKVLHPGEEGGRGGVAAAARSGGGRSDIPPAYPQNPPSYQQATQEEDLINLDGAAAPMPPTSQSPETKESVDLLSDLGGAAAAAPAPQQSSSLPSSAAGAGGPRHAYSHPKRMEEQDAAAEAASEAAAATDEGDASFIPTQQMLHDRYEENLKAREQARTNPETVHKDAQYLEDERLALMMQVLSAPKKILLYVAS